jgi:hypothetical protein
MENLDHLYTAKQAREKLGGISAETLKRYVEAGKIRKETPPTNKVKGYYNRFDVDKLVRELQPFAHIEKSAKSTEKSPIVLSSEGETDWIQPRDLPYVLALDLEVYGIEDTVDISITHAWWKKNPYMCRILYDKNDRKSIWGAMTIMPMREETIFQILRGEKQEKEITPDDILVYEPGNKYYGYAASAITRKEHITHFRGLLQSSLDFWCQGYPDIQLIKLYAYAATAEGWDLIKRLFFSPRYDLGRNAFELDPYQRNPSKYLKPFQDCLKEKGATIFEPEW